MIDEDCLNLDLEMTQSSFLAKVADVQVIHKLHSILKLNGFVNFDIRYIGGRWVWVELESPQSLFSFKSSVELNKVFLEFKLIDKGFVPDERVVWIDIVGVPLVAWTPKAFKQIGAAWGENFFADIGRKESLAHGKVCVLTKNMFKIREDIDIVVNGASFDVKIQEFAYRVPDFELETEDSNCSDSDTESLLDSSSGETLDFQKMNK